MANYEGASADTLSALYLNLVQRGGSLPADLSEPDRRLVVASVTDLAPQRAIAEMPLPTEIASRLEVQQGCSLPAMALGAAMLDGTVAWPATARLHWGKRDKAPADVTTLRGAASSLAAREYDQAVPPVGAGPLLWTLAIKAAVDGKANDTVLAQLGMRFTGSWDALRRREQVRVDVLHGMPIGVTVLRTTLRDQLHRGAHKYPDVLRQFATKREAERQKGPTAEQQRTFLVASAHTHNDLLNQTAPVHRHEIAVALTTLSSLPDSAVDRKKLLEHYAALHEGGFYNDSSPDYQATLRQLPPAVWDAVVDALQGQYEATGRINATVAMVYIARLLDFIPEERQTDKIVALRQELTAVALSHFGTTEAFKTKSMLAGLRTAYTYEALNGFQASKPNNGTGKTLLTSAGTRRARRQMLRDGIPMPAVRSMPSRIREQL